MLSRCVRHVIRGRYAQRVLGCAAAARPAVWVTRNGWQGSATRWFCTTELPKTAQVVRYHETGDPGDVLSILQEPLGDVGPQDVMVKMLAAPMNPADFNMIEGVYAQSPDLPAVAGNEGVGEVIAVGSQVPDLEVGDWVIPALPKFGTWRTHAISKHTDFDRVPNTIPVELAATIAVNPCTAYRMLTDFVDLKPGDIVVQNGANSGVGQAVIQLANKMGVHTVNILRDRPEDDFNMLADRLTNLGADIVCMRQDVQNRFRQKTILEQINALAGGSSTDQCAVNSSGTNECMRKAVLGLNCVGGPTSGSVAQLLQDGGVMVTYGGMSRQPVMVPTGQLIFSDIVLRGFWLTRWVQEHSRQERRRMIEEISRLTADPDAEESDTGSDSNIGARSCALQTFVETFPLSQFHKALMRSGEDFRNAKILLDLTK